MTTVPTNLTEMLRSADRLRYLAVLYVPEQLRDDVAVLQSFDHEIARVRDVVSEPMPGEIRLQWWREVVSGEREGEAAANPLANALRDVIDRHDLPTTQLEQMIDGWVFDLYDDPMPDRNALEGYFGETRSLLMRLVAVVLGARDAEGLADACGHGGVALGLAQMLTEFGRQRGRGQCFVPADILAAAGTSHETWMAGPSREVAGRVTEILVALGQEHLQKALAKVDTLPIAAKPAFMPLALCKPVFAKAAKAGGKSPDGVAVSPLAMQWHMLRFAAKL